MDADALVELVKQGELAQQGDAEAQFRLAEAYRIGKVVAHDYAAALRWYRHAAEQGHLKACNDLGSMYLNGLGTEPDPVEAAKWYRLAAEQGDATAQFNLALRYLHGSGVTQDDWAAAKWLAEATKQGHIEATCELGTLYRFGRVADQNFVSAAQLHIAAAAQGDPVAMGNLADYYQEVEKVALDGNFPAALCLARMHANGLGVDIDHAKALAWLRWGQNRCTPDPEVDADEVKDLENALSAASGDVKKRADELLATMRIRPLQGIGM